MKVLIALALSTLTGLAALASTVQAADAPRSARYRVTFERTWSSVTHPTDFPVLAHFSPVIGVTHGRDFELFHDGETATPGLEKLCEEGKHQPLDAEIAGAIRSGRVGALIETPDPLRSVPESAVTEFEIDAAHPMVSIGAMIAPSPDWCAVATDVSLLENGEFVAEKSLPLYAWDMGTDSATTYRAFDADMQPRGKVRPSDSGYFERDGVPNPVGRVTFTRLP